MSAADSVKTKSMEPELFVTKRDGRTETVDFNKITHRIKKLCTGLDTNYVHATTIAKVVIDGLHPGVSTWTLDDLASRTCANWMTKHYDYGILAARIAVSNMHKETDSKFSTVVDKLYNNIDPFTGERSSVVNETFYADVMANKDILDKSIVDEKDYDFSYFGLKTLEKSYLLKIKKKTVERPQHMLMRVSVALYGRDVEKVLQCYDGLSKRYFIHATPTLFNAGGKRQGLSSCFLLTVASENDSIEGIADSWKECASISKYSGGIGINISNVRAKGSIIKSTNGMSEGIIPMLKVYNSVANYVTQSNKRPGSIAVYIEPWHAEIMDFLKLKMNDNSGEKARDLFYALWIPDLFMEKVMKNEEWCLFCPNESPGLSEAYGDHFEDLYYRYEKEGRFREKVSAQKLYMRIIESQINTGGPYMLYKDSINKKNNQSHIGTITSSNLCCEVMEFTSSKETAVCFPADTLVMTEKGQRFIIECDNVNVLSPFESDTEFKKTSKFTKSKLVYNGIQPVYELFVHGSRSIKATANHLFLTKNKKSYMWKRLDGLCVGDMIVTETPRIEDDLQYYQIHDTNYLVAGWLFGDTNTLSRYHCDMSGPSELYSKTKVLKTFAKWESEKEGNIQQYLQNTYGFIDCHYKENRIPYKIFTADKKNIAAFLSGIYSANGEATIVDDRLCVTFAYDNLFVLQDVQSLLCIFDIRSYISRQNLNIFGTTDINQFISIIGFGLCDARQRRLIRLEEMVGNNSYNKNFRRDMYKVVRVEFRGDQPVYDLTLSERHNFVANNLVVHNCNLASLGLPTYIKNDENGSPYFDLETLHEMAKLVTRNLDKVIDITHYPVEKARYSNLRHRPIGIGISGLADTFAMLGLPFDSEKARELNKQIFETVYHGALESSCELAQNLGAYETFSGSGFSKGKFQFDFWKEADNATIKHSGMWDWDTLRQNVVKHGVRHSLLLAPMPTASTAQILGFSECIEPFHSMLYKRQVLSGEFQIVNKHLLQQLCKLGLWNESVKQQIIRHRGSIQKIEVIPKKLRDLFKTAYELSQKVLIDLAADRAVYIDQSQSMNLFFAEPTYPKLSSAHMYAWKSHLKTGSYYIRMKSAVSALQVTTDHTESAKETSKQTEDEAPVCTRDNKDCLTCSA